MSFNEIKLNQKFLIREYWIKMFQEGNSYLYEGFKMTSTVPWVLLNVENIDGCQGGEGDMRDPGQVIVVQR